MHACIWGAKHPKDASELKYLKKKNKKNIVEACNEQGLWVASAPCVHNPLQFVSLCEYALFRNGFGVYHRFANQLWPFQ